jgi:hypothetical protein
MLCVQYLIKAKPLLKRQTHTLIRVCYVMATSCRNSAVAKNKSDHEPEGAWHQNRLIDDKLPIIKYL